MSKLPVTHLFDTLRSHRGDDVAQWVGERLWRLNGDSGRASIDSTELAGAIRQAFDPRHDRVLGLPWTVAPGPRPTLRRRVDTLHPQGKHIGAGEVDAHAAGRDRRIGAGPITTACDLSLALGLAQARDTLGEGHWIVAVLGSDEPRVALSPTQLSILEQMRRFLIVYCEPFDPVARGNRRHAPPCGVAASDPLCRQLTSLEGLTWWGPVGGIEPEGLVSVLEALKELEQPAVLHLHLKAEFADASKLGLEAQTGTFRTKNGPESALARLAEPTPVEVASAVLGRVAATDVRVVGIGLSSSAVMSSLARQTPRRFFEIPTIGRNSLVWCAGLAVGGCRPFLSLTCDDVTDQKDHIVREFCEPARTVVLLVAGTRAQGALGDGFAALRRLPNTTVMVPGSADELERLLVEATSVGGPVAIGLPRHFAEVRPAALDSANPAMVSQVAEGKSAATIDFSSHATRAAYEHRQIAARQLGGTLDAWVAAYSEVGRRNIYLWKWCLHGVELTTLPCVAPEVRADACETKFLCGMLNVLLDDVADQQGNGELLQELLTLVDGGRADFERFPVADRRYGEFTRRVWNEYWMRVERYPFFDTYRELLKYDLSQLFNTVRYSHLLNTNLSLLNVVEHDHYSPQGMGLMSFATIDVMCSPSVPADDLGRLREAMWHAQWMARIGNLVTTWRRELDDRDYSSGVFARAIGRDELTVAELRQGDVRRIEEAIRLGAHEEHFLGRWQHHRACLESIKPKLRSVDVQTVIDGLERLLYTELGSRGFK